MPEWIYMTIIFGIRTNKGALITTDCRATSSDGEIKKVQKIFLRSNGTF